jgi:hypothetical protein
MLGSDLLYVRRLYVSRVRQRIESLHRQQPAGAPADIECRSRRGGYGDTVDFGHLTVQQRIGVHRDPLRDMAVVICQFSRRQRVHPFRAKQRGGRLPRHDGSSPRPQPCGARPLACRQLDAPRNIDTRIGGFV